MTSPNLALPMAPRAVARGSDAVDTWRTARERALRAPLVAKLLGANMVIALAAAAAAVIWGHPAFVAFIAFALLVSFAINTFLVRLALSPLDELQDVAERVSRGERYVRATKSAIADRRIERLGTTLNHLLDEVHADHLHMHQSMRRSLEVRETERAAVAHQLREATAQQLSALALQLAAADRGFWRRERIDRAARVARDRVANDQRCAPAGGFHLSGLAQGTGIAGIARRARNPGSRAVGTPRVSRRAGRLDARGSRPRGRDVPRRRGGGAERRAARRRALGADSALCKGRYALSRHR